MPISLIQKLKRAGLTGKGGASFPTHLKWEFVKKASDSSDKTYIIVNGSEGEPNVLKDAFLLKNHPEKVIEGLAQALKFFKNSEAYIYLREDLYKKHLTKLKRLTANLPVKFTKKPHLYLAGEETTILNVIEGKPIEPREKPPYPANEGLYGKPTLINNVETFYHIANIANDEYKDTRFYSISGDATNKGVYEFPTTHTIKRILKETDNIPTFKFFIQAGGGALGEILLSTQLNKQEHGAGAIIVYNTKKHTPISLFRQWAEFFIKGNCDKCVPCREGVYRIREMMKTGEIDMSTLEDLFFVMENTSYCPLGRSIPLPFKSLLKKMNKISK